MVPSFWRSLIEITGLLIAMAIPVLLLMWLVTGLFGDGPIVQTALMVMIPGFFLWTASQIR